MASLSKQGLFQNGDQQGREPREEDEAHWKYVESYE